MEKGRKEADSPAGQSGLFARFWPLGETHADTTLVVLQKQIKGPDFFKNTV